jgi:sugar O-acyltransferase (sialic acid O-acetyltransferase NeuD family)
MKELIVIGTGGLAREFCEFFGDQFKIVAFSSLSPEEHSEYKLPGRCFSDNITPGIVGTNLAVIALSSPYLKKRIHGKLRGQGFSFPVCIHPTSTVSSRAILNEGVVIAPNCLVSTNVVINSASYINFSCGLGHEAEIGSFCQINPGTQIGGGATIGEGCLVGSGATLLNNVRVAQRATIGSGSVVFSRVPENATMMGNPAKRMRSFEE